MRDKEVFMVIRRMNSEEKRKEKKIQGMMRIGRGELDQGGEEEEEEHVFQMKE